MSEADVSGGEGVATGDEGAANGATLANIGNGGASAQEDNGVQSEGFDGPDWRMGFSEGLDDDTAAAWQKMSGRFTSQADLAKSFVEKEREFSKRIPIPGKDADHETWGKVWDQLGRPPADKYEFSEPEGFSLTDADKEHREGFRQVAHDLGLSQKQLSGLEKWNYSIANVNNDAMAMKAESLTEQNTKAMKAAMGPDFDRNVSLYNTAGRHYFGDDGWSNFAQLQLNDGTFVADHPLMVNVFSKIGAERAEDFRDVNPMNSQASESAKEQIEKIEAEALAKGLSPSHHDWPHDALDPLYARAHPSKPEPWGGSGYNVR